MTPKTAAMLDQITEAAKTSEFVYPAFFQRGFGIDASVSAAIRVALKRGVIVQAGLDGCNRPKYRLAVPATTHTATATVN